MDCRPPGSSVHGILQARIWNGWPFPPPGDLPNPGIKLVSPISPALAGGFFTTEPHGKPLLFLQVWPIPNIKAEISTRLRLT